ncbi:PREDICTED: F-box/FBD/LRR-repeat protein At1g13570-like [Fragaria vesca subsp. vesca]
MIRHLVFDERCLSDKNRGYGGAATMLRDFENVVDRVLLLHYGSIDTFELSSRDFLAGASCIDRWFLYLLRNSSSVKEVMLKQRGTMYKVSSCMFLLQDLTRLELYNCLLKPPVEFRGFPRLKSLEILKVTVAQDVLEKIISCCPLLERMTLRGYRSATRLNIDAQNLQFLEVGGGFRRFELKNTPNLVGMKVNGFRGVKAEVDFLKALLPSSPLQELDISISCLLLKCYLSLYRLNYN